MGMTLIAAKYSRWVVDLNRDPQSKPLYTDGRIITALCPTTHFWASPFTAMKRKEIDPAEINRRLQQYYWPYHQQIEEHIVRLKKEIWKGFIVGLSLHPSGGCHRSKRKISRSDFR